MSPPCRQKVNYLSSPENYTCDKLPISYGKFIHGWKIRISETNIEPFCLLAVHIIEKQIQCEQTLPFPGKRKPT